MVCVLCLGIWVIFRGLGDIWVLFKLYLGGIWLVVECYSVFGWYICGIWVFELYWGGIWAFRWYLDGIWMVFEWYLGGIFI